MIFRMTEPGKTHWAFSHSLVSLLDFINIMLDYGLFTWKGNCYCSFTDVFIAVATNIHKVSFNIKMFQELSLFLSNTIYYFWSTINPSHPDINMNILHTVLNKFPHVLAGRIYLTIKRLFSSLLLPLFS